MGASLTVEAALVLPLFLLICSLFFTFFSGQTVQLKLQKAMDEICQDVAVWSYAVDFAAGYTGLDLSELADGGLLSGALNGDMEDIGKLISGNADIEEEIKRFLLEQGAALLWQQLLKEWLIGKIGREELNGSGIAGGAEGLSLSGSTLHGRDLDLVLSYRIQSSLRFPFGVSYRVVQRSCRRLWIGTKRVPEPSAEETEEETEEGIVYVTVNGTVYHTVKSCRVLDIRPTAVSVSIIGTLRNDAGGKYYPCERCTRGQSPPDGLVYITGDGIRYHYDADCPSLKRMLQEIAVSEAKERYRPCHYCGGGS